MAKPNLGQNADTGVFLLGDFWRDPAQSGQADRKGDRASQCAQINMVALERFSVVKLIYIRIIFPGN